MVPEENIRPQPRCPPHKKMKNWRVGDIAEAFDINSWRVGKIAKLLKNNQCVVRLFGSIRLKVFHKSNLRIRQTWNNKKWSVVKKVTQNKKADGNLSQTNPGYCWSIFCVAPQHMACEDTHPKGNDEQEYLKLNSNDHYNEFFPEQAIKENRARSSKLSSNVKLMRGSHKRRKSCLNSGQDRPNVNYIPLYRQVDDIASLELGVDTNCMNGSIEPDAEMNSRRLYMVHSSSGPLQSGEGSNQCSIASCSLNELPDFLVQDSRKSLKRTFENSDAESSFPALYRVNPLPTVPDVRLEADIHKLELHAYKSTMQALHASGPLSWEQESLLTNLRLSLHITNEEHLVQLKHLLSAQIL